MEQPEGKMEESSAPDIYQDLLVVDGATHFTVGPIHNAVILQTRGMSKQEVNKTLENGIKQMMKIAGPQIRESVSRRSGTLWQTFYLNYTTKYENGVTTPKGLCFVWFDSVEFANILLGKNPDGSERIRQVPNPEYSLESWDKGKEEEALPPITGWGDFNATFNWADAIAEAENDLAVPEFLDEYLGSLYTLMGRDPETGEEFPIPATQGENKIKKERFVGKSLSKLHVFCPDWVDLIELRTIFARLSSYSVSYPILEYYPADNKGNGNLYVSYNPNSKDAAAAALIYFAYPYQHGKNRTILRMDYALQDKYEEVTKRRDLITVNQKMYDDYKKSHRSLIPAELQRASGRSYPAQQGKSPNKPSYSSKGPSAAAGDRWERSPSNKPPVSSSSRAAPPPAKPSPSYSASSSSRTPPPAKPSPSYSASSSSRAPPPYSKPKPPASKPPVKPKTGGNSMFAMLGEE